MGKLYKKHQQQFRFRQFKPCPCCWRGREHSRHELGRSAGYPLPAKCQGWPYAAVDKGESGTYRIKCTKCGHVTEWYPTGVGAIREWNGSSDQWQ